MCVDVHLSVCQWRPAQDISFDILGDQRAVSDSLVLILGAGVTGSYGRWELKHWSSTGADSTLTTEPSLQPHLYGFFLKKKKSNHRKPLIIFYQSPPHTHTWPQPCSTSFSFLETRQFALGHIPVHPTHKHPVSLTLIYAFYGPDTQGPSVSSSLGNFPQLSHHLSIWTPFSFSWSFCLVLMKVLLCFFRFLGSNNPSAPVC